jgi:hypothetical protein
MTVQRQGLRGQLAHHDVQKRDHGEGDDESNRVDPDPGAHADERQTRLDETGDRGLAHEAQTDARQGDPELGGRDGVVEMLDGPFCGRRPPSPLLDPQLYLGPSNGDERKLRSDEIGVGEQERGDGEQTECGKA